MRKSLFIILIVPFILPGLAAAAAPQPGQQEQALQILGEVARGCTVALGGWQCSTAGGAWQPYRLGQTLEQGQLTLKTVMELGDTFSGQKIVGQLLHLRLRFLARGLVKVRVLGGGKPLAAFEVDASSGTEKELSGDVLLADSFQPGRSELTVEAENLGFKPERSEFWPPRRRPLPEEGIYFALLEAALDFPSLHGRLEQVRDWLTSMQTAYGLINPEMKRYTFTGKPYDIPDQRRISPGRPKQLQQEWTRAVLAFDREAFRSGRWDDLRRSLLRSQKLSGGLRDFAREFKVNIIGNAHIDIAWLWRMAETKMVARNTFASVLQNMVEYPEMRYAQSQAVTYDWMEKEYPDIFARIRQKVRDGQWEIVGGMWVEPDCNLISGESWVRQFLYGKAFFKEKFGVDVRVGWNPDSFGYNWNMPQLLRQSGIDYFITQKIWWNDTTVFPYYLFWWQGVDGSKLLTYFPPLGYTADLSINDVVNGIGKYEATTGYKKSLILYGLGDHGGGPNREILDRVRQQQKLYIAPEFIHSRSLDFLRNIGKDLGNAIPTWNDELYLEYHRGTYTTQSEVKKNNRRSEALLADTEKAASLAQLFGVPYPSAELERLWKIVLTNQFHDILPGSGITPVYRDALEDHARAQQGLRRILRRSLAVVAGQIQTQPLAGIPLLVFNSLAWERSDVVQLELSPDRGSQFKLLDPQGRQVPVEVGPALEGDRLQVVFVAEKLPPLGYRVYTLIPGQVSITESDVRAEGLNLENDKLRLELNPQTGNIRSLKVKASGQEFVPAGEEANALEVFEDRHENWDAWNIGYTGRRWGLDKADGVDLVAHSPVRAVLRVKKSFLGLSKERMSPSEDFPSSFFTQYITLYRNLDRVDIRTEADWWESHMLLKARFPVTVNSDTATYEIPYAAIARTTRFETLWEKARFEVSALKWADLSDSQKGLSLLNAGKYGHDIHGHVMRLSLLRSPTWPDPVADKGKHEILYSLYPHAGSWQQALTVHRGYELNNPLLVQVLEKHPGTLPLEKGFVDLDSVGVVLDTVKKSETDGALIFRFYESLGQAEILRFSVFRKITRAYTSDLLENVTAEIPVREGKIELPFKKFEIKTLKIYVE